MSSESLTSPHVVHLGGEGNSADPADTAESADGTSGGKAVLKNRRHAGFWGNADAESDPVSGGGSDDLPRNGRESLLLDLRVLGLEHDGSDITSVEGSDDVRPADPTVDPRLFQDIDDALEYASEEEKGGPTVGGETPAQDAPFPSPEGYGPPQDGRKNSASPFEHHLFEEHDHDEGRRPTDLHACRRPWSWDSTSDYHDSLLGIDSRISGTMGGRDRQAFVKTRSADPSRRLESVGISGGHSTAADTPPGSSSARPSSLLSSIGRSGLARLRRLRRPQTGPK